MALTYIETVRLLMGDLDEGDNNFFTADQWAHFFRVLSYTDADEARQLSLVETAVEAMRILSVYHVDARPERSKKVDDRVDQLNRWPESRKALYIVPGEAGGEPHIFVSSIYSAVKAATDFDAADFTSGNHSGTNIIAVGGGAVDRYLAFWQTATEDVLTLLRPQSTTTNRIETFEDPEPLTVAGVAGNYWRSTLEVAAEDLGKNWVVSRLPQPDPTPPAVYYVGWLRPYPWAGATFQSTDDITIPEVAAANFTAAATEVASSMDLAMTVPAGNSAAGYLWAAVPDSGPDLTGFISGGFNQLAFYRQQPTTVEDGNGVAYKIWVNPNGLSGSVGGRAVTLTLAAV